MREHEMGFPDERMGRVDVDPDLRPAPGLGHTPVSARWRWFVALWALSLLFHLANAGLTSRMLVSPTSASWWGGGIAVFAIVLMVRPDRLLPLLLVSLAVPVLAWLESPVMGNHWLVVTLVSLGIVGATVHSAVRGRSTALLDTTRVLEPMARGVFFVFYSFTTLSKVNRGFLDPIVSCGTYFTDETARSIGWGSLNTAGSPFWGRVVVTAIIIVELSVVALLVIRRTRVLGVFVAVVFHGIIGLDGLHSFADFSSLVYALLLLFLPAEFFTAVSARLGRLERFASRAVRYACATAIGLVLVMRGSSLSGGWAGFPADARDTVWRVFSLGLAVVVGWYMVSRRRMGVDRDESITVVPATRWLLAVVLLAFLNGLTPYVGVKTTYSWNMYSNLVTAPGYENGLLIPTAWRWTDRQGDLVTVLSSSDPGLNVYAERRYLLTFTTLRAYTSTHPDARLVYARDRTIREVPSTRADPVLSRPVGGWEKRLFAYRAVDSAAPARCQPYFMPAA